MNYDIEVDINTIYDFSNDILREGDVLLEKINKFLEQVEKIEECYDTETGKILKEKLMELVNKDKKMINDKYLSFSKTMKNVADIYLETKDRINKSVQ